MRMRDWRGRTAMTWLLVVAMWCAPGVGLVPSLLVAADPPVADGGWPRRYVAKDGAAIVLYEPQVAAWENQRLMRMHAAVSYAPPGS